VATTSALTVSSAEATTRPNSIMLSEQSPAGESCTLGICGVVHNQSGGLLKIRRDYGGPGICLPSQERWLASGHASNERVTGQTTWDDTDCFMSPRRKVFYLGWHNPGEWIRIHNPVWITTLG
jgi:hypothetical protein